MALLNLAIYDLHLECFHGMVYTKHNHNLAIFTSRHFLHAFLNIWRRFCDRIMQFNLDNILNFHYVVKLMHMRTMQWLNGVHL